MSRRPEDSCIAKLAKASALVLVCGCAALGCDKEGNEKMPKTAEGRVQALADHIPAEAEAALFVGDIGKMSQSLGQVREVLGAVPQIAATQQMLTQQLGFDPLDASSWSKMGVEPDSGFTIALVNNRAAIMTYVKDRQKFDAALSKQAQGLTGAQAATPKVESVGDIKVKLMAGTDATKQLAWAHRGELVVIGTPALAAELGGDQQMTAPQFVAKLATQKEEAGLAKSAGFKKFAGAFEGDKWVFTAYANPTTIKAHPSYKSYRDRVDDGSLLAPLLGRVEKSADALGLGIAQTSPTQLSVTAYMGADEETVKLVREIGKPAASSPWKSIATQDTLLGLRTSIDLPKAWAYYQTQMSDEQKQTVAQNFARMQKEFGIDFERDIITNMTGNIGLFFYNFDMGTIMANMRDPMGIARALNIGVGVQFKDEASVKQIVDKIKLSRGEGVTTRAAKIGDKEVADVTVFSDSQGVPMYVHKNLMFFGPPALKEEEAARYLTNQAIAKPLATSDRALGKRFGGDAPYNGLYLNVDRTMTALGPMGGMIPASIKGSIDQVSEASVSFDSSDRGLFATFDLVFKNPAGGAAPAAPSK